MTYEFWVQIISGAAAAAVVYAAIRADLATLHERSTNALESANRAHDRIDHFNNQRR
jgi:hypothetical protein